MKVKISDPGSNSAKRKRLENAISELVYETYNNGDGEFSYNEDDVLYINPVTFEIGICLKSDVPKGCHYHPIEDLAFEAGESVSADSGYLEKIANHYFPD